MSGGDVTLDASPFLPTVSFPSRPSGQCQPAKALVAVQVYYVVISTTICVDRISRLLEGSIRE
jgi:hypothetical protein